MQQRAQLPIGLFEMNKLSVNEIHFGQVDARRYTKNFKQTKRVTNRSRTRNKCIVELHLSRIVCNSVHPLKCSLSSSTSFRLSKNKRPFTALTQIQKKCSRELQCNQNSKSDLQIGLP